MKHWHPEWHSGYSKETRIKYDQFFDTREQANAYCDERNKTVHSQGVYSTLGPRECHLNCGGPERYRR